MNKSSLKPAIVFEQFAKINEIPRPSKREEKMIEYLKGWGESRGLDTRVDQTGNVIIVVLARREHTCGGDKEHRHKQ